VPFLIPDWSVSHTFFALSDSDLHFAMKCFVYKPSALPAQLSLEAIAKIAPPFAERKNEKLQPRINNIPPDWFVWSDDLITVHKSMLHHYYDRDNLTRDNLIIWSPVIPSYIQPLISACPAFDKLMPTPRRKDVKGRPKDPNTKRNNIEFVQDFNDIASQTGLKNKTAIIRIMCKNRRLNPSSDVNKLKTRYYRAKKSLDI